MNCDICNKKYSNINQLSIHISKQHSDISKEEFYIKYINPKANTNCKICGNKLKFKNISTGYLKYCSKKCLFKDDEFVKNRTQKNKNTILERYGVEFITQNTTIKEKIKNTNLEKYGVEYFLSNKNINTRNKIKQTNLEKYGVEYVLQSKPIKEKIKQTNIEKYGFENPFQSDIIKEKIKNTNLEKYGVEYSFKSDIIKEKIKQTNMKKYGVEHYNKTNFGKNNLKSNALFRKFNKLKKSIKFINFTPLFTLDNYNGVKKYRYKFQCNKCNNIFEDHLDNGRIPRCYICNPLPYTSKFEYEIVDFLKSILPEDELIIQSDRTIISPYELDIYLPSYNLAIEFNGLYWHSELNGKDSNYHINKTNLCNNKNIQLLHIFEDEWLNKKEIVKSIICNKLQLNINKIYLCECIIKEVDIKTTKEFLNNNHIQGYIYSKYRYGLYYNDELVFLLTICNSKNNKNFKFILSRFCSKLNTIVIGGFSKLLKYFISIYSSSMITYSDIRYETADLYLNNNFKFLRKSKPNYYYVKLPYVERKLRNKFQKHKLKNILENFNPEISEWENMKNNGYDRIWDCGNKIYILEK